MALFIKPLDATIGVDGFGCKKDLLLRKPQGEQLSYIVNQDEPLVVAVDAPWGFGKSVFLKFWATDQLEKSEVIYFDAFACDYYQDALSAIIVELLQKFDVEDDEQKERLDNLKKNAMKILRIAGHTAAGGVSDIPVFGPAMGAGIKQGTAEYLTKPLDPDTFWQAQIERKNAVEGFKSALKGLVEKSKNNKLVIIIDELDRCRPDFALDMLEITKHLFSEAGVTVIYGTWIKSLCNVVKARYGADIDAENYLRKFIDVDFRLDVHDDRVTDPNKIWAYFKKLVTPDKHGRSSQYLYGHIIEAGLIRNADYSYRDMNRLFAYANLISNEVYSWREPSYLATALITMRALKPELAKKALDGTMTYEEASQFFDLESEIRLTTDRETEVQECIKYFWGENKEDVNFEAFHIDQSGEEPMKKLQSIIARIYSIGI